MYSENYIYDSDNEYSFGECTDDEQEEIKPRQTQKRQNDITDQQKLQNIQDAKVIAPFLTWKTKAKAPSLLNPTSFSTSDYGKIYPVLGAKDAQKRKTKFKPINRKNSRRLLIDINKYEPLPPRRRYNKRSNPRKTKSKLCMSVVKKFKCRYGDKCNYAHSVSELKPNSCYFGHKCTNKNCDKLHPGEDFQSFLVRTGIGEIVQRTIHKTRRQFTPAITAVRATPVANIAPDDGGRWGARMADVPLPAWQPRDMATTTPALGRGAPQVDQAGGAPINIEAPDGIFISALELALRHSKNVHLKNTSRRKESEKN